MHPEYASIVGSVLPPRVYKCKHYIEITRSEDIVANSMMSSYIQVSYLHEYYCIDKSPVDCSITFLHAYLEIMSYACIVNGTEHTMLVSTTYVFFLR